MRVHRLAPLGALVFLAAACGTTTIQPHFQPVGKTSGTGTTGRPSTIAGNTNGTGTTGNMGLTTGSSTSGGQTTGSGTTGSSGASTGEDNTIGTNGTSGTTTSQPNPCGCAAGTFCDPLGSGRCLNCLSDSDCAAPTGVCQTSSSYLQYGQCVACSEGEATCPGTQVCDLSLGRTYHHCVNDCRLSTSQPACPYFLGPQHCSSQTGTCTPGCTVTSDCAPGPLICDVDAGACVECLTSADCPYSNPGCLYNTCGSCQDDTNCPAGLACDVASNLGRGCGCPDGGGCGGNAPVCVRPNYYSQVCGCLTAADCAAQQGVCQSGLGSEGACIPPCYDGGTDCSQSAQFCNLDSGLCGPCSADSQCLGNDAGPHCIGYGYCGCNMQSDCGAGNVCDTNLCRASCAVDGGTNCSTLQGRHFCDQGTGLCNSCSSDTQCIGDDAGPHCLSSGDCGCQSTSDCSQTQACDPSTSSCVTGCGVDGGLDCSQSNQVCDTDTRLCVQCLDDTQCASPTPACTADIHQGNFCVECVLPSQCPDSNPGCNATYFRCGWCLTDVDCPSNLPLCNQGQCVVNCVLADGGTYCPSGACDVGTGICVQCLQDSDCQVPGYPYCATDVDAGPYCVQCTNPSQCPDSNPGCYAGYYYCGICSSAADCPASAPICEGASCVPPCVLSDGGTYCASGVCDVVSQLCVECLQDSDCQQTNDPYCATDVDGGEFCVQCVDPSQCSASAPGCNAQYHSCGWCFVDTDCPSSASLCLGEACVTPCDGGGQCTAGACDVDAGFCVQCIQDSDCMQPGLSYCTTDIGYGNYCVQCVASSDCGDAGPCNSAYFQCGSCYVDGDCPFQVPTCTYNNATGTSYCSDGGF